MYLITSNVVLFIMSSVFSNSKAYNREKTTEQIHTFRCCTISIIWCAMRGEDVSGDGGGNIRFGCGSEVGEVKLEWSLALSSFVVWEDNESRQQYCLSHAVSIISMSSVRSNCRVDELRDLCWAQR